MNLDEAVVIALGSNLAGAAGSSRAILEAALDRFAAQGLNLVARSRWWRSAAWPNPTDPDYLNGVVIVETARSPGETLTAIHQIETALGRRRSQPNAPRTLDLDLIAHGRKVIDSPELVIPHPRAAERLFVVGPLAEIAPDWRHPATGETAEALAGKARVGLDARPEEFSGQKQPPRP